MGAYLVDYITYDCVKGTNCYEFSLKVTYQKTPAQLQEMVSATTAAALPDLLRTALEEDAPALTVKVGYLDRSAGEIEAEAAAILEEYGLGAEGGRCSSTRGRAGRRQLHPGDHLGGGGGRREIKKSEIGKNILTSLGGFVKIPNVPRA